MNLVGLRLHQSSIAQGEILSLGKDFTELGSLPHDGPQILEPSLAQGITYILEITFGEKAGVSQEITRWQGLRLTLPDDISTAGVHRKGSGTVQIGKFGEVKTGPNRSVIKLGFNLVATPFTTDAFLQDLGLANDLQKSDDPTKVDKLWIEDGTFGNSTTYFLNSDNC